MDLILVDNTSEYQHSNFFSDKPLKNFLHTYPLQIVSKLLKEDRYQNVIDIGCADGILLPTLSKNYKKVYAIDIQTDFFPYILKYKLKNLILKKMDVQKMNFKDGFFDLSLCLETLEHVKNPEKAIQEIKRVLKKDGIGIISVPIEIGGSLLLKQSGRLLLGYGLDYEGGYTLRELFNASILKKPNKVWHQEHLGHRGFDYRDIMGYLQDHGLKILRIQYLPLNIFGDSLAYRVIIKFKKV